MPEPKNPASAPFKDPVMQGIYEHLANSRPMRTPSLGPVQFHKENGERVLPAHWTEKEKRDYLENENGKHVQATLAEWKKTNGDKPLPSDRYKQKLEAIKSATREYPPVLYKTHPLHLEVEPSADPASLVGGIVREYPESGRSTATIFADQPGATVKIHRAHIEIQSGTGKAQASYKDSTQRPFPHDNIVIDGHKSGLVLRVAEVREAHNPLQVRYSDADKDRPSQSHQIHLSQEAKHIEVWPQNVQPGQGEIPGSISIPMLKDSRLENVTRNQTHTGYHFSNGITVTLPATAGDYDIVLYDAYRPGRMDVIHTSGGAPKNMPEQKLETIPLTGLITDESQKKYEEAVKTSVGKTMKDFIFQGQVLDFMEGHSKEFPRHPDAPPAEPDAPLGMGALTPNAPSLAGPKRTRAA